MKNTKRIASLFIIFAGVVTSSHAEVRVYTHNKKYLVSGRSIAKIRQDIRYSGLKDAHGYTFAAKTTPKFTWKYKFALSDGKCFIKSVDIDVSIKYELPELDNYAELSNSDKAIWDKYSAALYKHEQGHAQYSIDAAKEIERTAVSIAPKDSCGEVGRTANMLANNIFSEHNNDNLAYDTHTNHGEEQGASLIASQ